MALINPHINFNGNAEEAFNFYKSVFGGEFAKIMRFKDLASAEFPVAENEANKIMHIALPIGKNILMANDVPESMGRTKNNERLTTVWQNGGFSGKLSIRNLIRYKPLPGDQIQSSQPSQFVRLFSLIGGQAFFFWLQRSKGRQIIPTDSSKLSSF